MNHLHIGGYFNSIGLHTNEFLQYLKKSKEKNGFTISLDTQTGEGVSQVMRNHLYSLISLVRYIYFLRFLFFNIDITTTYNYKLINRLTFCF